MRGLVQLNFKLPALVEREGDWFVALCPVLDVASQGRTHDDALRALTEATKSFLSTCYEMGTLDNVLKECGFERDGLAAADLFAAEQDVINVPMELVAAHAFGSAALACR